MNDKDLAASIDWAPFGEVSGTAECQCGAFFRSHVKVVRREELVSASADGGPATVLREKVLRTISKDPCPACGGHRARGYRSDPESWSVRR